MSDYPPALLAHVDGGATSVCRCWRLLRRDGAVLGFTDHDRALSFDGTIFRPETGFTATEAKASLGMAVDATDIEGALSSDDISDADVLAGRYDGATVETFLVNWQSPANQWTRLRKAVIGKIVRADGGFVAELESVMRALDRPNGRHIRRKCDAELGDARCKFNPGQGGFHASGAVIAAQGPDRITVSGLSGFAFGWFANGLVTWSSGAAAGTSERVIGHTKAGGSVELVLWREGAHTPAGGDAFSIVAGCDKAFATCKAKFSNEANFRGFPHLPGNDAAYGYVTDGLVFDGEPIVP